MHLVGETRSFERAALAMDHVLGVPVSASTLRRVALQVGGELGELLSREDRCDGKEVIVPEAAVVSCDGGRIRTREPGQGRGVKLVGASGWRETKNASFEKMSRSASYVENVDSCPSLPTTFRTVARVAQLAEKPVPEGIPPEQVADSERVKYAGPNRVLRTAVSSLSCSAEFGVMMEKEARRRGFFEARVKAFIGDGLPWNWSIWQQHFAEFVPILDFVHAVQYLYSAAMAVDPGEGQKGWSLYQELVVSCWQGDVAAAIARLRLSGTEMGIDWEAPATADESQTPLIDAVRYLKNNQERMDYPRYRRLGLPVTSAPMESLIKQINYRVKGTEMFWTDPAGAEAILQIRAAVVSEDGRLNDYLSNRPGWPFVRRSSYLLTGA
jgi:hypothetical protein